MNVSIHIPKQYRSVWERIKKVSEKDGRGLGWTICKNWKDNDNFEENNGKSEN